MFYECFYMLSRATGGMWAELPLPSAHERIGPFLKEIDIEGSFGRNIEGT